MRRWCVERLDPSGTTVGMVALREKEQAKEQVRRWHTPTVDGHTAKLTYRTPTPEETARWHPSIRDGSFQRYAEEYLANLQRDPRYAEAMANIERTMYSPLTITPEPRQRRIRRLARRRRNREGLAD